MKNLKTNTKYVFKVRAYKKYRKNGKDKFLYGNFSKTTSVSLEDSKTVSSQSDLEKALKIKSLSQIMIQTEQNVNFTIPEGDYRGIDLIVDAQNADIVNNGLFHTITIRQIAADTWTENAKGITLTGTDVDLILDGINQYMMRLAERQIQIAFEQSESEVDLLHKRISEGLRQAREDGKQVGREKGSTYQTKKSLAAKEVIRKHSKDFGGSLTDVEVIKLAGISKNSYYKYKKELLEECAALR